MTGALCRANLLRQQRRISELYSDPYQWVKVYHKNSSILTQLDWNIWLKSPWNAYC